MERVEFISQFSSKEAIVERCYVSKLKPFNPIKASIEIGYITPAFVVGVYKREHHYYLQLSYNLFSNFVDTCFDNNSLPNCGVIELSEQEANNHINNLSKFGKNIYDIKLKNFDTFLNTLTSVIPCEVDFLPLFDQNGIFFRDDNYIAIANNNSHFSIIFALLHEYVHYLTQELNHAQASPKTQGEYIYDFWENLCNATALNIVRHYFPEHITNNYNKLMKTIIDTPIITLDNLDVNNFSIEQIYIMQDLFLSDRKIDAFARKISSDIIKEIDEKLKSNPDNNIDFHQSGLAVLSDDDNQKLYDYIINEVSPLIPPDDFED